MPGIRLAILLGGALAMAACGEVTPPDVDEPAGVPVRPANFTVRGRWADASRITYRAEERHSPLPAGEFAAAVDRACAAWNGTGAVRFVAAAEGEDADVTLGWRRGHHGACEPFGSNATVAHSGPVKPGSYVHFDADRRWVADAPHDRDGYSAYGTALHELGHVLGLGHSIDEQAVMQTGVVRTMPLTRSDVAGLQSLYGGGEDAAGDLRVVDADGNVANTLRGVAMPGVTKHALFDADGEGHADVLAWRTDRLGNGELMIYHLDERARLRRTTGPFFGMAAPGARNLLLQTEAGDRVFVSVYPNGKRIARRFDEHAVLSPFSVDGLAAQIDAVLAAGNPMRGDVTGDGRDEQLVAIR